MAVASSLPEGISAVAINKVGSAGLWEPFGLVTPSAPAVQVVQGVGFLWIAIDAERDAPDYVGLQIGEWS